MTKLGYKQFTSVGAFSAKFSLTTSGFGSKKLGCCNDGSEVLYRHAKLGGNRTTHVGVRVQSVMFFTF